MIFLIIVRDFNELKVWPDPDLNWGHKDFQSSALPTELSGHNN